LALMCAIATMLVSYVVEISLTLVDGLWPKSENYRGREVDSIFATTLEGDLALGRRRFSGGVGIVIPTRFRGIVHEAPADGLIDDEDIPPALQSPKRRSGVYSLQLVGYPRRL